MTLCEIGMAGMFACLLLSLPRPATWCRAVVMTVPFWMTNGIIDLFNGLSCSCVCTHLFLQLFDALALLERSYREIGRLPEVALASRGESVVAMATVMLIYSS